MTKEFFAQIEPLLKEAGFKGKIDKSDGLAIWKGNTSVIIHHHPMPYDEYYERVCVTFGLKNKDMRKANPAMVLWLNNHLSCYYPEFSFVCLQNNDMLVRYVCDILEPQDMLNQLAYAIEFFRHVRQDYLKMIPEVCKDFQFENE